MEENLINILEQILQLSAAALSEVKRNVIKNDAAIFRQQFKLLKSEDTNDMTKKKKLPPGVREFREDYYQARKTAFGISYIAYGSTPEEAAAKLKTAIAAPKTNISAVNINPAKTTYAEYLIIWRDTYKAPKLAEASLYQINNVIRHHMPDWLKALPLLKLTSILIQRALNEVKTDRMREYTYTVYSDSLGWAYDLELIKDIMRNVPAVRYDRKNGKAMTIAQQDDFIIKVEQLPDVRLHKLFKFYLLTGARLSEPLTMTASDFDIIKDSIHIPGTKNKYSDRTIPYFSQIKELVADWLPSDTSLLFPFTANFVANVMEDIFPDFTQKDLRHTFATRCKECGIPTDVYKQWLGHSKSSKVAETTYTHYDTVNIIESKKFTLYPEGVAKFVAKFDPDNITE